MDALRQHIDLLLLGLGFTVWLIRLEASMKSSAKDIHRLWEVRKEDLANGDRIRQENHELLKELRDDMKTALIKISKLEGNEK